ncbi:Tetratricopeptide repeat [Carpediemonas membranifera]|uniref:Tetratricopeptide repeat n=1 Tax=Carpediemonas membranifera TaxID=201153 RepID=A0A8J6BHI8_9EUKA|nr:Tetratricopeptide repeat [Carpediemonas membranifera]|eukprot:KAG9397602.1 Tetratricopeptide repeat [Carpediemonas membranifera]
MSLDEAFTALESGNIGPFFVLDHNQVLTDIDASTPESYISSFSAAVYRLSQTPVIGEKYTIAIIRAIREVFYAANILAQEFTATGLPFPWKLDVPLNPNAGIPHSMAISKHARHSGWLNTASHLCTEFASQPSLASQIDFKIESIRVKMLYAMCSESVVDASSATKFWDDLKSEVQAVLGSGLPYERRKLLAIEFGNYAEFFRDSDECVEIWSILRDDPALKAELSARKIDGKLRLCLQVDVTREAEPVAPNPDPANHVAPDDVTPETVIPLSVEEQAVLLALGRLHLAENPTDTMSHEQYRPYLSYVLSVTSNSAVRCMVQQTKATLLKANNDAVEAALRALEYSVEATLAGLGRNMAHLVPLPAFWRSVGELAVHYMAIGSVSHAISLYRRLGFYSRVVELLIMTNKAEEARALLAGRRRDDPDDVTLLCLQGEVHGDKAALRRAWAISNGKSARARRSLSALVMKEDVEEGLKLLLEALNVEPGDANGWRTVAQTYVKSGRYAEALAAFKRVTILMPDSESDWSDLATAYLATGDRENAFRTYMQAVQVGGCSPTIWRQVAVTAVDTRHFAEAVHAFERTVGLVQAEQLVAALDADSRLIDVLVHIVVDNVEDRVGNGGGRLAGQLYRAFEACIEKRDTAASAVCERMEAVKQVMKRTTET